MDAAPLTLPVVGPPKCLLCPKLAGENPSCSADCSNRVFDSPIRVCQL